MTFASYMAKSVIDVIICWLIGKNRTKQVARIEQCSIVKTVAWDF